MTFKPRKPRKTLAQILKPNKAKETVEVDTALHIEVEKNATEQVARDLDLTNDSEYNFMMNQVAVAGHTEETSPMLMKVLAGAKDEADNPKPKLRSAEATPEPEAVATIASLGGNSNEVEGYGITSVEGGSIQTTMTMQLFDNVTDEPLGEPVTDTKYDQGEFMGLRAKGVMKNPDNGVKARMFYAVTPFQGPTFQKTIFASAVVYPKTPPIVEAPVNKPARANASCIKIGLNRRSNQRSDCDYYFQGVPVAGGTPVVELPLKGKVTFRDPISPAFPNDMAGGITVVKRGDGGGQALTYDINKFRAGFSVNLADPYTANWDFTGNSLVQFDANYWPQGTLCDMFMSMQVVTNPVMGGVKLVSVFVNSEGNGTPLPNEANTKPLKFVWGCLAKGSMIRMADGSEKAIEDVEVGDRVLTNLDGSNMEVEDTFIGKEQKPMVKIDTDESDELLLSDGHPVITPDGVKLAKDIRVGDMIYTDEGVAKITSVTSEMYNDTIHNLGLKPDNTGGRTAIDDQTFYANGILVGDNDMQGHYGKIARQKKGSVLQRLPKEWHTDYLNSLKR